MPLYPRSFRFCTFWCVAIALFTTMGSTLSRASAPGREQVLQTMKRAARFMVEKMSREGGYVWSTSADFSRAWGELEAKPSMIWVQNPGTPGMGNLFLDAYHVTGDEYYYQAAEKAGDALVRGQLACGGWNYVIDFAGEASLRQWYDSVGRNAWRLEEFQHYYGNATFDDGTSRDAAIFLLRLYVEKKAPRFKAPLEKALKFFLESQYPVGAWPQRYPLMGGFSKNGHPDYSSFLTFNDDVTGGNIDFLVLWYQAFGDARVLDAITRGMNSYIVAQVGPPQSGWALQYTPDLKPAGARSYEPKALATHTTASCIEQLFKFYRLTGETKFLARVPQAFDWLEGCKLPVDLQQMNDTHPTFVELGTNRPLFIHRSGSNVVNGKYSADYDPKNTVKHYSSFRRIELAQLRETYAKLIATPPDQICKDSPLLSSRSSPLPRIFTLNPERAGIYSFEGRGEMPIERLIQSLNADGAWLTPLRMTSHPCTRDGDAAPAKDDYSQELVGDETDTSPYRDRKPVLGISTMAFIRNMSLLIRELEKR